MRRVPRHFKPLRKPVFIGCEGASEHEYVAYLQNLTRDAGLPIYMIIEDLGPGAGDTLERVKKAVRKLDCLSRTRDPIKHRYILLDSDQAANHTERDTKARQIAKENNIIIVWQEPCFEALLLRHLPNFANHRPVSTSEADRALKQEWPGYSKPVPRKELSRKIDIEAVRRVAAVEAELRNLLVCLLLIAS
jgi:RloB-like protein